MAPGRNHEKQGDTGKLYESMSVAGRVFYQLLLHFEELAGFFLHQFTKDWSPPRIVPWVLKKETVEIGVSQTGGEKDGTEYMPIVH